MSADNPNVTGRGCLEDPVHFNHFKMFLRLAVIVPLVTILSGCGHDEESKNVRGRTPVEDENQENQENEQESQDAKPALALDWRIPCDGSAGHGVSGTLINGMNTHTIDNSEHKRFALRVNGDGCAPAESVKKRDVFLLVDLTSAMAKLDPALNGTCSRFRALQSLILSSAEQATENEAEGTRYGIVLFGSSIIAKSNGLFSTLGQAVDQALAGMPAETAGTLDAIVCADQGVGDSSSALNHAQMVMTNFGRPAVIRQVSVVAHQSSYPRDAGAIAIEKLISEKVVVSGRIFGEGFDASWWLDAKDSLAEPWFRHGVLESEDVLIAVEKSLDRVLANPSRWQLSWRAITKPSSPWETVFITSPKGVAWQTKPIMIDSQAAPQGFEIRYRIMDRFGLSTKSFAAMLTWSE